MKDLAHTPYCLRVTNHGTNRTKYLAGGGRLVNRKTHASPLQPNVAEQLALSINATSSGRITATASPL